MSYTIKGKLIVKKPVEQISATFSKMEFVIETEEQYPQKIPFQLVNTKTNLLDNTAVGAILTVHYNMRGKEHVKPGEEPRYFLTLEAWRFE